MARTSNLKQRERSFVSRFRELTDRKAKVDFETAGLAHEVRQCLPVGASGDHQFRVWCVNKLDIHVSTARMLLEASRAFLLFPKEEEWLLLRGWDSVRFLMGLGKGDRRKVYRLAQREVEKSSRRKSIGVDLLREIAYNNSCVTRRNTGRPTRTQTEESLGHLRSWVVKLYDEYELPAMPAPVKAAMKSSKLSQLSQ